MGRVGRGAGALGARGAKKWRPRLWRGALQNFGGTENQNSILNIRSQTQVHKLVTSIHCQGEDVDSGIMKKKKVYQHL